MHSLGGDGGGDGGGLGGGGDGGGGDGGQKSTDSSLAELVQRLYALFGLHWCTRSCGLPVKAAYSRR